MGLFCFLVFLTILLRIYLPRESKNSHIGVKFTGSDSSSFDKQSVYYWSISSAWLGVKGFLRLLEIGNKELDLGEWGLVLAPNPNTGKLVTFEYY